MQTYIRPITHTHDEITMGQAYWHYEVPTCDVISATANMAGFTPLNAIKMHFGWDNDNLIRAAAACNRKGEVCIVDLTPKLFLVPATKGQGDAPFLIGDVIAATRAAQVRSLHFTHFGFIQSQLPRAEVIAVLKCLFSEKTSQWLSKLVIDIDSRIESEFYGILAGA